MAFQRPPNYCFRCGALILENHTNMGKDFMGDTFCGYQPHTCDTTTDVYKHWVAYEKAYKNSPEGKKHAEDVKKMLEYIKEKSKAIAEANEAIKAERTQVDDLNKFLREIADNDKVGIKRKLTVIKKIIANIENGGTCE